MADVDRLLAQVADWALEEPGVRAVILLGSHARTEDAADEWSDVDLVVLADDPARLVEEAGWVARFGTPELTLVEATAVGGQRERRVLYDDGLEVDFAVFPAAAASALAADPEAAAALARGFRLLHDELGLAAGLAGVGALPPPPRRAAAELVQDFWHHALWSAKKLRRGEALTALACLEGVLKPLLRELAREHALARTPGTDTWHRSRFVERWADPRAVAALWVASPRAPGELPDALRRLGDAFDALAAECLPPVPAAAAARTRLASILEAA